MYDLALQFHIYFFLLIMGGCLFSILLVGTFNQEKALVGAFSVILKSSRTFVWSSSAPAFLIVVSSGYWMKLEPRAAVLDPVM